VPDPLEELDGILEAGAQAKAERERHADEEREAMNAWGLEFGRWINDFVIPTLEPFAARLREKGHEVKFETDRVRGSREENPKPLEFKMRIGGDFGSNASVELKRRPDRVVTITRSAGGGGMTDQNKSIDSVTEELLQRAVLDAVRERLGS
jgi:hypothetical protein